MLVSGALLVSGIALVACSVTPAQANANATKIVEVAQAGTTTLTSELRTFNVTLTGDPLTAYNALIAAVTGLSNVAITDANAIATFATAPTSNIAQLLTDAATLILAVLRVIPGASSVVGIIEDVITAAPLVTTFAQLILTPSTAAPTVTASRVQSAAEQAAVRLGVTL